MLILDLVINKFLKILNKPAFTKIHKIVVNAKK